MKAGKLPGRMYFFVHTSDVTTEKAGKEESVHRQLRENAVPWRGEEWEMILMFSR